MNNLTEHDRQQLTEAYQRAKERHERRIQLEGNVRLIYQHGEPHGIRDNAGYLCMFNKVTKFSNQEERYQRELAQRRAIAEFILNALRSEQNAE